ncbi:MAG: hypothetical protein M5U13_00425 [Thermoanaerobaculia bacterium]|nr:hypothetical protein [Thermoanaerobaculia bacterium]
MRAFLAIVLFEVRRRWLAFPVALGAGSLSFLLPALAPQLRGEGASLADARSVLAVVLPSVLCLVLCLALGPALVARDAREKRLSFFLARPVGGFVLLLGRAVAAAVLAGGASALLALPFTLGGVDLSWPEGLGITPWWDAMPLTLPATALAAPLIYGLAAAIAITVSARMGWMALELAAIGGAVAAAGQLPAITWLWLSGGKRPVLFYAGLLLVALVPVVLGALRGRVDLGRMHGAQAVALAAIVALAGGSLLATDRWYRSPAPHDLDEVWGGEIAPGWFELSGVDEGRENLLATFVFDEATSSWVRLRTELAPGMADSWPGGLGGPEASIFTWKSEDGAGGRLVELSRRDGRVQVRETPVAFAQRISAWALSQDGGRLAVARGRGRRDRPARVELISTEGKRVADLEVPEVHLVRDLALDGDGIRALGVDLKGGICSVRWSTDSPQAEVRRCVHDPCASGYDAQTLGSRIAFWLRPWAAETCRSETASWRLLDAESLETVANLAPDRIGPGLTRLRLLPDGRWVVTSASNQNGGWAVRLFDPAGRALGSYRNEPGDGPRRPPLALAGRGSSELLVEVHSLDDEQLPTRPPAIFWLDLEKGTRTAVSELEGLESVFGHRVRVAERPLFRDTKGRLFVFEPATGGVRPLL